MGIFKDENGRSYGDWTHRDQGRTRVNANQIAGKSTTQDGTKWYNQTGWIILALVVLWPLGLVLMWRSACSWPVVVKVLVTVAVVFVVILSYQMSEVTVAANGTLSATTAAS